MNLLRTFYYFLLRTFHLIERRCGWCNKFLGYKRSRAPYAVSHGICELCQNTFEAEQDALAEKMQRKVRGPRQRRSIKNLRRSLGSWSGAAASQRRH